ncbi:5-formyltetrahydrofolate cyclo-ligase [Parvibaculum sp.]|jgi:5-formyltetrahydrofolate cyclo-ligase|uniref:5-formyltetrahydrofolate cyclo-ligase n=1 Tax=Parvibaculum sp. TaxID=2024848 RepID=UPI000C5B2A35|nr:5-formyltetrahydrofolate cyclo-ligase [Parvibaculum sp.]MAM94705.1 5-formyltetrahydrofolate cyclo-ligase [Parvibaculum sp.]HCX67922.1 5-formyltetrahydrofolate cyclo-ligase [Rhodobiaceae bacterium]|tara:strand:- start:19175 stop:19765 length:591 start_codon:yes stop_codon:yes gene_type:complete
MSAEAKQRAREQARLRRDAAHAALAKTAPALIASHFLRSVPLAAGACVAGYAPIGSEPDPTFLLGQLAGRGHPCVLPRVALRNRPLIFNVWQPGDELVPGDHGTREPRPGVPERRPDVVLVPLLAFDSEGRRLGYGGGYYDRTFEQLRRTGGQVLAVGVAFSAQEAQDLPEEDFDARLDWIVTEKGARAFGPRAGG